MKLILLASPTLRRGPLSALQRFVRDYERFLHDFDIYTTEGCRRALLRSGLLQNHRDVRAPLPGYLGGVVYLSSLVVQDPDSLAAVVYLIDPKDPSSIFPETNAMKRECVVHNVTFLSTSRAAREWAAMNWSESSPRFTTSVNVSDLPLARSLEDETIALIAHDGKKQELLEFASEHFDFLLRFKNRVATGTTGTLLNARKPDRVDAAEWETLRPACEALQKQIEAAKARGDIRGNERFVDEKKSGPKGGDVAIARMVLDGNCHRILFFENPLEPHEHTEDIQLLERTGRLHGKSTLCVHDRETAAKFVRHWTKTADVEQSRVLLSFIVERLFGAKCVLVESKEDRALTWHAIREAASWFLLSHVATLANERKRLREDVRVSVAWGVGCSQIVDELQNRLERLEQLERYQSNLAVDGEAMEEGATDSARNWEYQSPAYSLADSRYFRPGNVIVAPIQGLVGSEDESVEANEIAHRLSEFFCGSHLPLAANVLVSKGSETDRKRRRRRFADVYAHWANTDIVLATAGPVVADDYEGRPRTPHFTGFTEEMSASGACGDVGGLFLDRRGKEVIPDRFDPTSIGAEHLKAVHARRGVVVVAGAQPARSGITLAALRGGWVSVLVSDTDFVANLVRDFCDRVKAEDLRLMPRDSPTPLLPSARLTKN